jgi:hypothetical protein
MLPVVNSWDQNNRTTSTVRMLGFTVQATPDLDNVFLIGYYVTK